MANAHFVTGFSFNLLALLFCAHYLLPKSQAYTSKFFNLQYFNDKTNAYGAGFDDVYFVLFIVVLLTGLRAAAMEYFLAPFAKYMGLRKKKEVTRFSEQAWLVIYCSIFWSLGLVRKYHDSWFHSSLNDTCPSPRVSIQLLIRFYNSISTLVLQRG